MKDNLNIEAVNDLIKLAEKTTEEAKTSSSPILTRAKSLLKKKLPQVAENVNKMSFSAINLMTKKPSVDEKDDTKTIPIVINWIVSLLKDVISKLNDQGDLITNLIDKLSEFVDPKETLEEEFKKKHEELETDFQQKSDTFEKIIREKHDALETELKAKQEVLERNCDEARQRGLKGNLIISSPERKNKNGEVIPTLAVKDQVKDNIRGTMREETDAEMIVRLIKLKTEQEIPLQDIVACHPIGKKESHTYILSIANRKPKSSWDIITHGMRKGEYLSTDNIFINYQLTARRIALSKEVKQARKSKIIQKYSIDANGKIWVKALNKDSFKEVKSKDNLQKLINNIDF